MLDTTNRYNNIEDFEKFILTGKPLSTFEYYFGMSLTDTVLSNQLRKIAYKYAVDGKIYLVQKKINHNFIFIAIKASTPPVIKLLPLSDEKLKERIRHMHRAEDRSYRKGE